MAASFFQMHGLIIGRLRDVFAGKIKIEPMVPDSEEIQKRIIGISPVIYVYYGGYSPGDGAGNESSKIIKQIWTVVLVIRNYQNKPSENNAIQEADIYTDTLISSLLGWQALNETNAYTHGALELVQAPPPIISKGAILFPFSFQTTYPLSNTFI